MVNIFLISHILLLFHSPKGLGNKWAKYEKPGKHWPYCTRNRAITSVYFISFMFSYARGEDTAEIVSEGEIV